MPRKALRLPGGGSAADLRYKAETARDFHSLARIAVQAVGAGDEAGAEDALAEIERLASLFAGSLLDAADRVDHKNAVAVRAEERAERTISHHIKQVVQGNLNASFVPHGYFVYCLWGTDDSTPLYVGRSSNVLARLGTHLGDHAKRSAVERVTLTRASTHASMCRLEWSLIREYQPRWNSVGIVRVGYADA